MKKIQGRGLILLIIGIIMIIIGGTILFATIKDNNTKVKTVEEITKDALDIIMENGVDKKEDFKFIEVMENNNYKFLNKIKSSSASTCYYIVDINKNTYTISTVSKRGDTPKE